MAINNRSILLDASIALSTGYVALYFYSDLLVPFLLNFRKGSMSHLNLYAQQLIQCQLFVDTKCMYVERRGERGKNQKESPEEEENILMGKCNK